MIEYIATFLAGALIMCIGVVLFLLKRSKPGRKREPHGLEEPTNPEEPPILPINPIERAEEAVDAQEPDPDPDTDPDYINNYIRESTKLDE